MQDVGNNPKEILRSSQSYPNKVMINTTKSIHP